MAPGLGPDRVRVSRTHDNQVTLDVKLYFGHGDVCEVQEAGHWTGSSVLVQAEGLKEDQPCELEATFDAAGIHLRDKEHRCTPVYCGARGTLDGASLPKKAGGK